MARNAWFGIALLARRWRCGGCVRPATTQAAQDAQLAQVRARNDSMPGGRHAARRAADARPR